MAQEFDQTAFCEAHGFDVRDLERYPLDGYTRTRRNGATDHPYTGCSVWLLPDTPLSLTTAAMDLRAIEADDTAGRDGFAKLCTGLSQVVAGHDVPGLAQWYGDTTATEAAPAALLFYVFQIAISGEVPEDRPNASSGGRGGTSTRPRMATKTAP